MGPDASISHFNSGSGSVPRGLASQANRQPICLRITANTRARLSEGRITARVRPNGNNIACGALCENLRLQAAGYIGAGRWLAGPERGQRWGSFLSRLQGTDKGPTKSAA
mmetsp:Transcript_32837/g.102489  ORF Transcript_32837/g.102489 Transcript_32837/m.102489 type:complete len:110 (+) Transcript_32837:1174-1503(+)